MKKQIVLLGSFLFMLSILQARQLPLMEAIDRGLITLTASGEGGHTGKCLKLKIENLQKKSLEILVPAGLIFAAADSNYQDLMTTQETVLIVKKDQIKITKMHAACIRAPKGSPAHNSGFNMSLLATGKLLTVAKYLAEEKLFADPAAQYAVWAVSDQKRLENIDHGKLANFMADLLGKPRPEYVVVHRTVSQPGEPAYREAPSILKGRWVFELTEAKRLTFGLFTKEGELKHAFFKDKMNIRGLHKFNFTFKVFNLPPGTYLIRMMDGEQVVEEMEVEF